MRISDWSSDVCSSDLPEILVQVRKGNARRTAAAGQVVDELVADGVDVGGQVGADIGEATLIGRLALRIGIGAAQVELDPVEIEFGDELRIDQLALDRQSTRLKSSKECAYRMPS